MVKSTSLLVLCCALSLGVQTSKPPTPGAGKQQSEQGNTHRDGIQSQTEPQLKVTPSPPVGVTVECPACSTPSAEKDDAESKRNPSKEWRRDPNWWLVGLTSVLALIAFGQACLFWWQLRMMKTSLSDSKIAAEAARDAAVVAKLSANIASDTAIRQLRAYLCIAKTELRFHSDGTIEPILYLKNSGLTPAYKVKSWSRGRVREYPLVEPLEHPPDGLLQGVGVIPPSHFHIMSCGRINLPDVAKDDIQTKGVAFFVYGSATYVDVFKNERTLRFQLIHGGPAGTRIEERKDGKKIGFLAMDAEGNEAD